MADQEQLEIMRQGVKVWNRWRAEHPNVELDLREADLTRFDLTRFDLYKADLYKADLYETDLVEANLYEAKLLGADLTRANLAEATLTRANLTEATLSRATLTRTILTEAKLTRADLTRVDLTEAKLTRADLTRVDLTEAKLTRADLTNAIVGYTTFGNLDLHDVDGLDTVQHSAPSTMGIDTIYRSEGNIPAVFLRNAGVPNSFIEYMRSLTVRPIEYYSCFISYSSKDQECAERLHADLQSRGVRCWFAPHDMEIGKPIVRGIDEAIRIYDKLLIILSESSITSGWVEFEVTMALTRENAERRMMLFPIRIDDAVLKDMSGWAIQLRSRHIGDFRGWKDHDTYQARLTQLLRDLLADDQVRG